MFCLLFKGFSASSLFNVFLDKSSFSFVLLWILTKNDEKNNKNQEHQYPVAFQHYLYL